MNIDDENDDDIDLSTWPLKKQEPLPEEFEKILRDNWWDLLG